MRVKFNHPRQLGGVIYAKGFQTVPDAIAQDPYFKILETAGDVSIIPDPMTPEQLEAKKQTEAKAKADADAKLRAEIKAEILAEMEADKSKKKP